MDLIKRVIRKSVPLLLILCGVSLIVNWDRVSFAKLFGNTRYIPHSIIIGGLLGLANLRGLVWGIETLLGTQRANTRLVYLSLIRLGILFAIIITLAAMKLINLIGLVTGLTIVFLVMIFEGLKIAKR
ncbi:MAG: hypothetical protein ACK415_04605 [Thermodesulfovibrionales bacterium]